MKTLQILTLWLASCILSMGAGSLNGVAVTAWNGVAITSWNGTGVSSGGGSSPSNQIVTAVASGATKNDYTGWVGVRFTVGGSPINMTHVGRHVLSGNSGVHEVGIWDSSGTTKLASANVATSGVTAGTFAWAACSYTLAASTTYVLASAETFGGDTYYQSTASHTFSGLVSIGAAAFGAPLNGPNSLGPAGQAYGPQNIGY